VKCQVFITVHKALPQESSGERIGSHLPQL